MTKQFIVLTHLIGWLLLQNVYAQSTSPLDRKLSFQCQNCTCKQVFRKLRRQHDVRLTYNDRLLPGRQRVNVRWDNARLGDGLQALLPQLRLRYELAGRHVVILRAEAPPEAPANTRRQSGNSLRGVVRDGTTGEGLIQAVVRLLDTPYGALTHHDGSFELRDIPPGDYRMQVTFIGFDAYLLPVKVPAQNALLSIDMVPKALKLEPAVIESDAIISRTTMSDVSLSPEELQTSKGISDDPMKALATLPGAVMNDNPYRLGPAQISIRGGDPIENLYQVDNVPVFWPSYFLGKSIFNPKTIDQVEVLTGGFPASIGHTMSSVIHFKSRNGDLRHFQAQISRDFFNSHLTLETPLAKEKASALFTFRDSHYGTLVDPNDFRTPVMRDLALKLHWKVSTKHQLTYSSFVGIDNLETPIGFTAGFHNGETYTQSLQWQAVLHEKVYNKLSFVHGLQQFRPQVPGLDPWNVDFAKVGMRDDLTWYLKANMKFKAGFELFESKNTCDNDDPASLNSCDPVIGQGWALGGYTLLEGNVLPRLSFNAGLRADHYQLTNQSVWSPRLAAAYQLGKQTKLRAAWGHYYQEPTIINAMAYPGADPTHSRQYILGLRHRFSDAWSGWIEAYQKQYRNLNSLGDQLEPLMGGFGHARGIEVYLHRGGQHFRTWLAYSLSSTVKMVGGWEQAFPTEYDQRHLLNLGLTYTKGNARRMWLPEAAGLTLRMNSGSPFTELLGYEIVDLSRVPVYGPTQGARLPWNINLNGRVAWQFEVGKQRRWRLGTYVECWNVLNRENIVQMLYADDPTNILAVVPVPTAGFGRILNLGLKLEFGKRAN